MRAFGIQCFAIWAEVVGLDGLAGEAQRRSSSAVMARKEEEDYR